MAAMPVRPRPRAAPARVGRSLPFAALGALALLGAGCKSGDPLVTIEGGVFTPSLKGDVGLATSVNTDVDTINLSSELGLGATDVVPYLRGELAVAGFDVALSGFRTKQSGHGTVTADFGDITAGSTVDTKLDLGLAHAHVAYDLFTTKWLTVGAGLGADYIDLSLDAFDPVFMLSESIDVRQVIPLVEARTSIHLPVVPIDFDLAVGAITGSYHDVDGTVIDAEAMLHGRIAGPVALFCGYRYVHFDIKGVANSQSFDGNVVLSGFMLGASIRF
jgi:hypothetical protein